MATPMIREQFENITALGLALRTVFNDEIQLSDPLWALANVQTSSRAAERNQGVGGFGDVPEYNGAIEYDGFELLYRTTYEHKEYALGMEVERKLIDDEEYGVMRQRASKLGLAFDRTVTKHLVSIFNNAFAATPVGGDAVSLCNDSHPYSSTDADTQGNKGTSALSHDAIITTATAMMQFEDSRHNPMNVIPDTLVVPVALVPTARVILESVNRSGNANNDTNINRGYNLVSSHYLTDAESWFLVDSRLARQYLKWFWRVRPEFVEDPTSDYNLAIKYRGYMRYSYGWDHWAWIYGHTV
jgi:phage major head subunit gpT-like protein